MCILLLMVFLALCMFVVGGVYMCDFIVAWVSCVDLSKFDSTRKPDLNLPNFLGFEHEILTRKSKPKLPGPEELNKIWVWVGRVRVDPMGKQLKFCARSAGLGLEGRDINFWAIGLECLMRRQ